MGTKSFSVTDGQELCTLVRPVDEPLCPPSPSTHSAVKKSLPETKYENKQSSSVKKQKKVFGYELILDLRDCDPGVISSRKKLQEYVDTLCKLIKMKKYGKTLLPYFGEKKAFTKGYSLVQLIETSSITGHFSEFWGTAYINIFSCKAYDHRLAKKFTKEFFGAKSVRNRFIVR